MRQIFFVPASGAEAAQHFKDTIVAKKPLSDVISHLAQKDAQELKRVYKNEPFAVWGARPGRSSTRLWGIMKPGDYILFYQSGRFSCIGEIAHKVNNPALANDLWGKAKSGETWENVYFIINEKHINVELDKFNELFGFAKKFLPQGFAQIKSDRQSVFERHYGDVYDVMLKLNDKQEIREKREAAAGYQLLLDRSALMVDGSDQEKVPSEHVEIQSRLKNMGLVSNNEVWVASNDRSREYHGTKLGDGALPELPNLGLDPDTSRTVSLIDTIWLRGMRVVSAFEIENSTQIFSGLLRLADLKAQAPNLAFPLYIVAPDEKRDAVMRQLGRPAFGALSVSSSTRYFSYSRLRQLDEMYAAKSLPITQELLDSATERYQPHK